MRISIEGSIGAGKSTALGALQHSYCVHPEPVEEWADVLDLFYADPVKWTFALSVKVLLSFTKVHDSAAGVCVVERSPAACRHVFTQLLYNDGKLADEEWKLFKDIHDDVAWAPDAIVYIHTPVDVCLDRIRSRGRACERHVTVDYLKKIETMYDILLRFSKCPVVHIDGTKSTLEIQRDTLAAVARLTAA